VEGNHATGFRFRHADGSVYGEPSCPQTALDRGRAFQALCRLGFRPSAARQALEQVGAMSGADASLEQCVRQALRLLTQSRAA
jgi:Holliday junction resolvasome RuvABC DNA-binding subunit